MTTTTDPYRFDGADGTEPVQPGVTPNSVVRTALWLVLVISTVGNMVASYGAAPLRIHLICGAVTALAATVLVVRHLRGRR
jgi:hypothetical protein